MENERRQGRPEQGFIPGLLNDVVLEHIATKLPWVSMYALAAVNRAWRRAIRCREIYQIRRHHEASQVTLVALVRTNFRPGFFDAESQDLFVFPPPGSVEHSPADLSRDESFRVPVRGCLLSYDKVHSAKNIVFLNGKLYALQEILYFDFETRLRQVVLELDVATCDREWKRCSSSLLHFYSQIWVACNGKIYAFRTMDQRVVGKVFDPCTHQWAEIKDKPVNVWFRRPYDRHSKNHPGRVTVLGTEIYVEYTWESEMMIFDSVTEIWRTIPNPVLNGFERGSDYVHGFCLTVIEGKIFNLSRESVEVYDPESNSWAEVQRTYSLATDPAATPPYVLTVASSGDELFALLGADSNFQFRDGTSRKLCKAKGFGAEGEKLVWEDVDAFQLPDGTSRKFCKRRGFGAEGDKLWEDLDALHQNHFKSNLSGQTDLQHGLLEL